MRVLEIGTGSGYNAALLADLVGDASIVTTVEIDSTLIEPARRRLRSVGCADVVVVDGDGGLGVASGRRSIASSEPSGATTSPPRGSTSWSTTASCSFPSTTA